jgi:hypothetical protein
MRGSGPDGEELHIGYIIAPVAFQFALPVADIYNPYLLGSNFVLGAYLSQPLSNEA